MASLMSNSSYHDARHLFQYAIAGKMGKIQKTLDSDKTMSVDITNGKGQTLLYVSCLYHRTKVAILLLEYGANPNKRSDDGSTPTHAAAYSCSVELLKHIVEEYGGDMRLHDKLSRTPKDWALRAGKRASKKVIHLIKTWQSVVDEHATSEIKRKYTSQHTAVRYPGDGEVFQNNMQVHCCGYGDFLCLSKRKRNGISCVGLPAVVPLAYPDHFTSSESPLMFTTPPGFLIEEALWRGHKVSIKRSRNKDQLHFQDAEDLLIAEAKANRHLRHPNLLLLMSMCLTSTFGSYSRTPCHWLVYEPIKFGSLHHILHKTEIFISLTDRTKLMEQIAKALFYLHERDLVHGIVTSHAIYLTDSFIAKLGDLFCVCCSNEKIRPIGTVSPSFNRWAAPEIILNKPVNAATDVYSYCVVVCESLSGVLPWTGCDSSKIEQHIRNRRNYSMVPDWIPTSLKRVFQLGLKFSSHSRMSKIEYVSNCLESLLLSGELQKLEKLVCKEKLSKCHMSNSDSNLPSSNLQYLPIKREECEESENLSKGIDVPDAKPMTDCSNIMRTSVPARKISLEQKVLDFDNASTNSSLLQNKQTLSLLSSQAFRKSAFDPVCQGDKKSRIPEFASNVLHNRPHSCIPIGRNLRFIENQSSAVSPASCSDVRNSLFCKPPRDIRKTAITQTHAVQSVSVANSTSPFPNLLHIESVPTSLTYNVKTSNFFTEARPTIALGPPGSVYIPDNLDMEICPSYEVVCNNSNRLPLADLCDVDDKPDGSSITIPTKHDHQFNESYISRGERIHNQSETCISTGQRFLTEGVTRSNSLPPILKRKINMSAESDYNSKYDIETEDLEEIFKGFAHRQIQKTSQMLEAYDCGNEVSEMCNLDIRDIRKTSQVLETPNCGIEVPEICKLDIGNIHKASQTFETPKCANDLPEICGSDVRDKSSQTVCSSEFLTPTHQLNIAKSIETQTNSVPFNSVVDASKQASLQFRDNPNLQTEENASPYVTCIEDEPTEIKPSSLDSNMCMFQLERGICATSLSTEMLETEDHNIMDPDSQTVTSGLSVGEQKSGSSTEINKKDNTDNVEEIKNIIESEDKETHSTTSTMFKFDEFGNQCNDFKMDVNAFSSTKKKESDVSITDLKCLWKAQDEPDAPTTPIHTKIQKLSEDEAEGIKTPSKWSFEKKLSLFKVVSDVDKNMQHGNSVLARGTMFGGDGQVVKHSIAGTPEIKNAAVTAVCEKISSPCSSAGHSSATKNKPDSDLLTSTPVSHGEFYIKLEGVECKQTATPKSFADVRAEIEAASSPINPSKLVSSLKCDMNGVSAPNIACHTSSNKAKKLQHVFSDVQVLGDKDSNEFPGPLKEDRKEEPSVLSDEPVQVDALEQDEKFIEGIVRHIMEQVFHVRHTDMVSGNCDMQHMENINEKHLISVNQSLNEVDTASYFGEESHYMTSDLKKLEKNDKKPTNNVISSSRSLSCIMDELYHPTLKKTAQKSNATACKSLGVSVMEKGQEMSSMLSDLSTTQQYNRCRSVDTSIWSV